MKRRPVVKKGQALVEFALVLPIFIIVLFGIVDFGRAFHCWITLNYQCTQAVRAGTRRLNPLIARNVFNSQTHAAIESVYSAFWANQSPMMATSSYNIGITGNNPVVQGPGSNSDEVTVSATFEMVMFTPVLGALIGGDTSSLVLKASARENKE